MKLTLQKYKEPDKWQESSEKIGDLIELPEIKTMSQAFSYIENYCASIPYFHDYEVHSLVNLKGSGRMIIQVYGGDPNRRMSGIALMSWMNKQPVPPMLIAEFCIYDDKRDVSGLIGKFNIASDTLSRNIKLDDFWEKCNKCKYFDGYDICLVKDNFGTVTDKTKCNCENNGYFREYDKQ